MFKKNVQKWMEKWVPNFIKNEIAGLRHFLPQQHFLGFFVRFLHGVLEVLGCLLGGSWAS